MKALNIGIFFFLACWTTVAQADSKDSQPIFPQQLTAQDLLTYCSSSSLTSVGRQRQRYCWGFISGVEETIRLTLRASGQSEALKICAPKGASSRKLAKAYTKYAGHRDADLTLPAAQIAIKALANAYAC